MSVKMMIQFNGKNLTLPINPEEIEISQSANNNDINIIGLGPITTKGQPGLEKLSIESFFPGPNSFYYTGVKPKTATDFIKEIWNSENKNNNVAKFVTMGLPIDYDMYFVIDDFDYDHRAGEEEDIYYKLSIKRYVPYGAKIVNVQLSGLAAARASALKVSQTTKASGTTGTGNSNQYYIVKSGDSLWAITKAACGDGSKWKELYNLNKKVIGSNPNLIYPGQKLLLPKGWKVPGSTGSKATSSKSARTSSKKTSSTSNVLANVNKKVNVVAATIKAQSILQSAKASLSKLNNKIPKNKNAQGGGSW